MDRYDLISVLERKAARPKPCHWIYTPDGDEGHEWCPTCGRFKFRNLRRHDRRHRSGYFFDGGWRTEHDSVPFCAGCHSPLTGSLTEYGATEELRYYKDFDVSTDPKLDALYLSEILAALSDDHALVETAMQIGQRVLSALTEGEK